jgi:hypothetical protein
MTALKASDVGFFEVTYGFTAECDDCSWNIKYREATVKDCRDHVRYHKHSVIRTRRTVGKYYVVDDGE